MRRYAPYLSVAALALLSFFTQKLGAFLALPFPFSAFSEKIQPLTEQIVWYSLLTGSLAILFTFLRNNRSELRVRVAAYLLAFAFFAWNHALALYLPLALTLLFYLERLTPKQKLVSTIWVIGGVALLFSSIFFTREMVFSSPSSWLWQILTTCISIRFLAWVAHVRIYERPQHNTLLEFLEFFFCPIFFFFPSSLDVLTYPYFHQQKKVKVAPTAALALGVKGLLLMLATGVFLAFFQKTIIPLVINENEPHFGWLFVAGFCSLSLIVLVHSAVSAFQVAHANFLGYGLRYDMEKPMFARSPYAFWLKCHTYARDYLVEVALRPIAFLLLRSNVPFSWSFLFTLPAVYLFGVSYHLGYRPHDVDRTWSISLTMASFFLLLVVLPMFLSKSLPPHSRAQNFFLRLSRKDEEKPLRAFTKTDIFFWIFTIGLLSSSKAAAGLVKFLLR